MYIYCVYLLGHYVSDAYDFVEQKWRSYDDHHVTYTTEKSVKESRATTGYIFFYADKWVLCEVFVKERGSVLILHIDRSLSLILVQI